MDGHRTPWLEIGHISVLWSFAVAQPLYALLGRQPEFFVAQSAGPADLIAFVLLLSLAPPLAYAAVQLAIDAFSPALRRRLHLLSVAVLFGAIALPVLKRIEGDHATLVLACALLLAIGASAAYAWWPPVRTFCTVLTPAVLFFPLYFLFWTPVISLLFPEDGEVTAARHIKNPVPIVMIVFDEFNPTVLLDDSGRIDEVRFPNFAALARDSWWFRNTTAVHAETNYAVPAILTGQYASTGQSLPVYAYHQQNLFAWLGQQYEMNVSELITELCPRSACPRDDGAFGFRVEPIALFIDLAITYLHVVTPQPLAKRWLPEIRSGWKGFARFRGAFRNAEEEARAAEFQSFIDGLLMGERTLNFLHILLPHVPYQYLPSGAEYFHSWPLNEQKADGWWSEHEPLVETGYLQYMFQVGYMDRMIGRMVGKLKAAGQYDEALIVITADHGVAIEAGKPHRVLRADTAAALLQIPLFIKLPNQSAGQVSDRLVSGIDIASSIASVLETDLPWKTDGHSVFGDSYPARNDIVIHNYPDAGDVMRFPASDVTSHSRLTWQAEKFGVHVPLDQTVVRDSWASILGQSPIRFDQVMPHPDLFFDTDTTNLLSDVKLREGPLPVFLGGRIDAADHSDRPRNLALALNGVIVSTAETFVGADSVMSFMLAAPVSALKNGWNAVDVFEIELRQGRPLLRPILRLRQPDLRIDRDDADNDILVTWTGTSIPVRPGAGNVDLETTEGDGEFHFLKCPADGTSMADPALSLLIFADGKLVYSGSPAAVSWGDSGTLRSHSRLTGDFCLAIPKSQMPVARDRLRFFSLAEGVARELEFAGSKKSVQK